MCIWSAGPKQNHASENFALGWARQFYHVDAVRTYYLWIETHSGMNVIPVSCKWRLSYLVWNQSTSTFSKSLKLELIYLVINKSGQLLNLFVCVIFLIRFEVSQPTPTLQTPNHLPPPPPPPPPTSSFLLFPILSIWGLKSRRISLKLWLTCRYMRCICLVYGCSPLLLLSLLWKSRASNS